MQFIRLCGPFAGGRWVVMVATLENPRCCDAMLRTGCARCRAAVAASALLPVRTVRGISSLQRSLQPAFRRWSEQSHRELQDFMATEMQTRLWRRLVAGALYWRVDDVESTLQEAVDRGYLIHAEKEVRVRHGLVANLQLFHLTPSTYTPSDAIAIARNSITPRIQELSSAAQRLLLQNLSIQVGGVASSVLFYMTGLTAYSAGSVGAAAIALGFYRLQRDWSKQRVLFEGFLQDTGRGAIEQAALEREA